MSLDSFNYIALNTGKTSWPVVVCSVGLVGYNVTLTLSRSRVRASYGVYTKFLIFLLAENKASNHCFSSSEEYFFRKPVCGGWRNEGSRFIRWLHGSFLLVHSPFHTIPLLSTGIYSIYINYLLYCQSILFLFSIILALF